MVLGGDVGFGAAGCLAAAGRGTWQAAQLPVLLVCSQREGQTVLISQTDIDYTINAFFL